MFIFLLAVTILLALAVYGKRRKASRLLQQPQDHHQQQTRESNNFNNQCQQQQQQQQLHHHHHHHHHHQNQQLQRQPQNTQTHPSLLMPRPPTIPLFGNLHLLRDYPHNPWEGFNKIREEYGDIVSLKMGIHEMALVSSKSAMNQILLSKGIIFANRPKFPRYDIIFGGDRENSLALCSWSNVHKDRRKFCKRGVIPVAGTDRHQQLEDSINIFVQQYINKVQTSNQVLRKKDILYLTSDIFMDFLCKKSYKHDDIEYEQFVDGCDYVFWDINHCYLIDFLPFLTSFGISFFYLKHLKKITDFLRDFIDNKIFQPRLLEHESSSGSQADYLDNIIRDHLEKKSSMTLTDYQVGFADLIAGHAAVANILMRLLGHLALDRDVQDLIAEEARNVVDTSCDIGIRKNTLEGKESDNSSQKYVTLSDKPNLPMTEAATYEALRLASSPIVPHVANEDTTVDSYHVPKGTIILFNNYYLNLCEDMWDHPEQFKPQRFLRKTNDGGQRVELPAHFKPFSQGRRSCLGFKMVETTTMVLVANLCMKFIIKPVDKELTRKLICPKGSIALDPHAQCFELELIPR